MEWVYVFWFVLAICAALFVFVGILILGALQDINFEMKQLRSSLFGPLNSIDDSVAQMVDININKVNRLEERYDNLLTRYDATYDQMVRIEKEVNTIKLYLKTRKPKAKE